MSKVYDFLKRYMWDDILVLATEYPDKQSLHIDFRDLEQFDSDISDDLLINPDSGVAMFEKELREIEVPVDVDFQNIHVRFHNLPSKIPIRDIREKHVGKFLAVEGLIRRVTEVRPKYNLAAFKCVRCEHVCKIPQDDQKFVEPYECENESCGKKGPFLILPEESDMVDAQNVLIQESPENVKGSSQPQDLEVYIEDDISGILKPGDRVVLSGVLKTHLRTKGNTKTPFNEITLHCNHVELLDKEYDELEITPEEEQQIQEMAKDPTICASIVSSIAPSIYGYDDVKEALALQLFSGVAKEHPDGSRIRGDIHVLLMGDPGLAKSQLLRYMRQISPRGVFTSGKSTSGAGLTAAAVQDKFTGRWQYEAGALPMADLGLAAVDELDKMSEEDTSSLHEALEQQTITLTKAGIMVTLLSRCAMLGAANPKYGRFSSYEPYAGQIDMDPALISRFDLLFVLLDTPDNDRDDMIADHILHSHRAGEMAQNYHNSPNPVHTWQEIDDQLESILPPIEPEFLRKYVAYARREVFPIMQPEAKEHLKDFYKGMRSQRSDEKDAVPVTARQLEALVRIAEASARMRLSDTVTLEDAQRTTRITNACLRQVSVDPATGKLDTDILYSGTSASQRDKIHGLTELMRQMSDESDSGRINAEMLREKALKMGFSGPEFDGVIKKMKNQGDLMQVNAKEVRLV